MSGRVGAKLLVRWIPGFVCIAGNATVACRQSPSLLYAQSIVLLVLLSLCVTAYGNETAVSADDVSRSSVDPADFNRSDLKLSERDDLKDQFAAEIVVLLERIEADFPPDVQRPTIEITGLGDTKAAAQHIYQLQNAVLTRDINTLLRMMRQLQIRADYERRADAIVFASALAASPGARMRSAIENGNLDGLVGILENEQPDLQLYLPGWKTYTPLLFAVVEGNVDATRVLLEAGANPDTRDRGGALSPLFQSLSDNNNDITRILVEAGADLHAIIGTELRMSPVAFAVQQGQLEDAALLIEYGADPDVRDYAGWTALMDAIFNEQHDAIDLLIPVSDPRNESNSDITRRHRRKSLDVRFLPSGNALFLALRMLSARAPAIADALRDRARELEATAGHLQLELSAQSSNSRLNWFEGNKQQAIDAHRRALVVVDLPSITESTNGDVITQSMMMLTELHEMLLMTGQALTDAEYASVAHITELGGWHQPLHDMLDILAAGRDVYPAEQLDAWQAAHGIPLRKNWQFDRLNTWIESLPDTAQRDRLFDVLDFFVMSGWRR